MSGDTDSLPPRRKAPLFVRNADSINSRLLTHIIGVARGSLCDPLSVWPCSVVAARPRYRGVAAVLARGGSAALFPLAYGAVATAHQQNARATQVASHPCIFFGLCSAPSAYPLSGRPCGVPARLWCSPLWGPLAPCGRCGLRCSLRSGARWGAFRPHGANKPAVAGCCNCGSGAVWCKGKPSASTLAPYITLLPFCVIHLSRKGKKPLVFRRLCATDIYAKYPHFA